MSETTYYAIYIGINIACMVCNIVGRSYKSFYDRKHSGNCVGARDCFIAGTLVLTAEGYKKIEDIQVGDLVLAYDEDTGETAYKPVVHLFRNESKDWTEVTVNGTEIVSTPGHKYYLPETKTWVSACKLKVGTKVLLSDGSYGTIEKVRNIHYDTPQTTYNFEVEDFHTYYVSTGVLVHNKDCVLKPGTKEWNQAVKDINNPTNKKGKLNYIVKNRAMAESLVNEAGLPLQSLDTEIYVHAQTHYIRGYEIHPIDNNVGLPHLRFWSGRTNGHIYWLE